MAGQEPSISDEIAQEASRLDDILLALNKEALNHRNARDKFHQQADVLAEKRNELQAKARRLTTEARTLKDRRDDCNLSAKEAKAKRDEWNDRAKMMKERGGLGDIGEARTQAQTYHDKMVKLNSDGQLAHQKMHALYEEADALRAQADDYHQKYLDCKKAADFEHEKYIAAVRKIEQARNELPD